MDRWTGYTCAYPCVVLLAPFSIRENQGIGLGHFYNPRLRFMVVGIFEHVHTCASVAPRTRRMCYGYMTTTFIFFSFFLSRPVK